MNYLVDNIISDVKIALDENQSNNDILAISSDTLDLESIITEKIVGGLQSVLQIAPMSMIDTEQSFSDSAVTWLSGEAAKGAGSIDLPSDFLRFVKFKMSDWRTPVVNPIHDTDIDYLKQSSPFAGIRGNANRPKCVLTKGNNGRVLEFYSSNGGEGVSIDYATYIQMPVISDGLINIPQQLYQATIYQIAGLVANTYKDSIAQSLFTLAASSIQKIEKDGD